MAVESRFYRDDGRTYLFDFDSSAERKVGEGIMPAWSPDGRRIVVYRRDVIYVINVEHGDAIRIAAGQYPAWSPDGTRLALNDQSGIAVVNADGSDYHTIVRHGLDAIKHPDVLDVFVIEPVWSPDAKNPRLAFTLQDVDHGVAIGAYIADANGSNVQALSGDAPADGPSWSSDGSHVAFATWSMQSTSLQSASVVMRTVCCGTELETISRLSNVSFKSPGGPSGFSRTIFIAHRSVRCTHLVFGSELSDLQIVKSNLPALPSPTHWVSAA